MTPAMQIAISIGVAIAAEALIIAVWLAILRKQRIPIMEHREP